MIKNNQYISELVERNGSTPSSEALIDKENIKLL